MRLWIPVFTGLASLVLLQGCLPASTFQTPAVVQPGQSLQGVGLTAFYDFSEEEPWLPAVDFYQRRSARPGQDWGLRIAVPHMVVTADIKFQIREAPIPAAVDLAACFCMAPGVIPSLLLGPEAAFAVLKFPVTILHTGPGLALGSRRGNLLMEMNVFYARGLHPEDEREPGPFITFGAAVQRSR